MTAAAHPSVVVLDGLEQGAVLSIDEILNDFVIGSAEGCHLLIAGDNVSPLHACAFLDDEGRVTISDTNSRDGVFVNGAQVMEKPLADGDEISLGDPASSGSRRLRFVAVGSDLDLQASDSLPPLPDLPALDSLPSPDVFDAAAFTSEIARPPRAGPESSPFEDLAPLPEPEAPPRAPIAPAKTVVAPPQKAAAKPTASAAPAKTPTSPPRVQPSAVAKTAHSMEDADDPLAGLAESLGGSSGDEFIPPPPVEELVLAVAAKPEGGMSSAAMAGRLLGVAAVLGVLAWYGLRKYSESVVSPVVDTYQPSLVEPGQIVTINGSGFGSDAEAVKVFLGKVDARVLDATDSRINISIPESLGSEGSQTLSLKVTLPDKSSTSRLLRLAVVPKITSISPRVARPGDDVVLAGRWLSNAKMKSAVTVAGADAEIIEASPTLIRFKIPQITAAEGQKLPVRVAAGPEVSKESWLIDGHLPFIESVSPERVLPGEVVTIAGLGLSGADLAVRVGTRAAVVLAATDAELRISTPGGRIADGAGARELVVEVAQKISSSKKLDVRRDSEAFYSPRFFADSLAGGRVAVSCELGPVMVLGDDAASHQRAHDAAQRLNALSAQGRASRMVFASNDATITATGAAPGAPVLVVVAGDGGAAPRSLASVWAAQLTDMFDLFLQGRRPGRTVELSPDGRVFVDIFSAARRRSADAGVPQGMLSSLDPAWQRSLLTLASTPTLGAAQASYVVDGYWSGAIEVKGAAQPRKVEISLTATDNGVVGQRTSRQGRLSTDVTLQGLSYAHRELRFSFIDAGEALNYVGRLDGDTIDGLVTRGGATIGKLTFKLSR